MRDNNCTRCQSCRHYAEIKEPFTYSKEGYPNGVTVYGFCGKKARECFSFYPVYIPDGGVCKEYKKKPEKSFDAVSAIDNVIGEIKDTPAADVQEVNHGEWIHVGSSETQTNKAYKCSHCKKLQYYIPCDRPQYCPHCGAKMDGKAGDNKT